MFLILSNFSVFGGEIVVSGIYQGKNLFVQNPFAGNEQGYCVEDVYINNVKKMSNLKHSAFEIDLSYMEIDDPVTIRITHKDGCIPKIINPQVLRPSTGFQFLTFKATPQGLEWTTSGESSKFIYQVEQFVNSSWLLIKRFEAKNEGAGVYSLPVTHTSGPNKYRIKVQNSETHQMFYSRTIEYTSTGDPVTFYPKSVTNKITLSRKVPYEVLGTDKKVIKKGVGTEIPLADLKMGVYYLNIDNRTEKFLKK